MQTKIPKKEDLSHGSRISCEIDGVKIEDARIVLYDDELYISNNTYGINRVKISTWHKYIWLILDEEITSDKYKIRLVEEEKYTALIIEERWGMIVNGKLQNTLREDISTSDAFDYEYVRVTVSYLPPKKRQYTRDGAEQEFKIKII